MIKAHLSDEYQDIAYLELSGSLLPENICQISDQLELLMEAKRPFIIVKLFNADKISGAVIGELLEWRSKLHLELRGDMALAGANSDIDKTLHELEAHKVFHIFSDLESAVNYLYWEYKGLSENILLTIPNQLVVVPPLRNFIRKCILSKGYSAREAFQVETIVDELCNNAIEHGKHGVKGIVEVALAIGRNKIEINIANGIEFINGENSSPEAITRVMESFIDKPSSTIDNPRGRGLALVKMLASEFDIDSSDDGTCVHVTKYREV